MWTVLYKLFVEGSFMLMHKFNLISNYECPAYSTGTISQKIKYIGVEMEKEILNNDRDLSYNIEVLSSEFALLIEDNKDPKVYFKKKKYPDYFNEYCSKNSEVFEHITKEIKDVPPESEKEFLRSIAAGLVQKAETQINALKGMKRRNRQSELNLFLVTSVFPCTIKLGDNYGEELCKILITEWKKSFPGNELGYADYDELNSGFRSFWGFLTGR